jgi:ABC-type microcin C transport system permease subunit YejE
LRLSAPWWWITSVAVIVATLIVLVLIDNAKQRGHTDD